MLLSEFALKPKDPTDPEAQRHTVEDIQIKKRATDLTPHSHWWYTSLHQAFNLAVHVLDVTSGLNIKIYDHRP